MSQTLFLSVKAEYFFEIQSGYKTEEYRLFTPYWRVRLEDRDYSRLLITLGYTPRNCVERRLFFPWRGFRLITITHPHFGLDPVLVYAIRLSEVD